MILCAAPRGGAFSRLLPWSGECIFCFNYSRLCKVKTASLARVHDEAKSFNLFLVKSHLLWLPFQIKKSCMIWKIDGISFLNSRPDVEVSTKPREVKRSLTETLRRPRCRICVCASFEGFWTRFVMDRCREHLLRLWIDPTMPWCLLYYNRERRESEWNNNEMPHELETRKWQILRIAQPKYTIN